MGKKILIGCIAFIGAIFLVFGIIVTVFVVSDFKQEDKLDEELEEIYELSWDPENMDFNEISKRLKRIVTKDDYAVVEKAMKDYISDIMENDLRILELLDDEKVLTVLTVENYENDGPNFSQTKRYIGRMRSDFQECKQIHRELKTEARMMSYIENCDLDSYFEDFYRERMKPMKDWDADGTMEESLDYMIHLMDIFEDIICFLSDNQGYWEIEDEYINFESDELAEQYDELLYGLYEDDINTEEIPLEDGGAGFIQL